MRFISEILSRKGFSLSSYTWKRHGGAGDLAGWSGCVHLCVSILLAKDRSRNATVAVRSAPARGGATSGRSGRASGSQSPTARRAGFAQAFHRYLDVGAGQGRAQVVDAAEWLDGLGYLNFLGAVERHFSINRLLTLPSRSVSTARVFAEQDGGGPRSALTLSHRQLDAGVSLVEWLDCSPHAVRCIAWRKAVACGWTSGRRLRFLGYQGRSLPC